MKKIFFSLIGVVVVTIVVTTGLSIFFEIGFKHSILRIVLMPLLTLVMVYAWPILFINRVENEYKKQGGVIPKPLKFRIRFSLLFNFGFAVYFIVIMIQTLAKTYSIDLDSIITEHKLSQKEVKFIVDELNDRRQLYSLFAFLALYSILINLFVVEKKVGPLLKAT